MLSLTNCLIYLSHIFYFSFHNYLLQVIISLPFQQYFLNIKFFKNFLKSEFIEKECTAQGRLPFRNIFYLICEYGLKKVEDIITRPQVSTEMLELEI